MAELIELTDTVYIDPEAVDAVYLDPDFRDKRDDIGRPIFQVFIILNCGNTIEVISHRGLREVIDLINLHKVKW